MPFTFDFPSRETRIKNTIRIEVLEEHRQTMDLGFIVREILMGVFCLRTDEILCLQDQERRGVHTVTFTSLSACENIYAVLSNKELREERLDGLKFFLLYGLDDVPLVVHMFNPHVLTADITTFLKRYCTEAHFSHIVKDSLGHWNGKRKFFVKFQRDPDGVSGFMHPPSNFSIGSNRGYLFYSGMPLYCCNCFRFGHTSDSCKEAKMVRCNRCGQPGHTAAACKLQKVCNMCGQEGHIYKDCPPKSVVVTDLAKTTLEESGEQSMLSVRRTPVKSTVLAKRSSVGPEKVPAELPAAEPSMKVQSSRRRLVVDSGQEPALATVGPALGTLAVGSEQSARKVPGAVESKQTFAVPSAVGSSVGSSAKTIPDAPCDKEEWSECQDKKKAKRSRRKKAKAAGSTVMEKSDMGNPDDRKPKKGATSVSQEGCQRPAEKRPRSKRYGVQEETSSSSEGESRIEVDPQCVSASDPVNIDDPASPNQGEEGSQVISGESNLDSDMDILTFNQ
ncbi:hypothetical protein XELAEV_18040112mg [Xenopus laevis]|uniref:CCHC-type domain-containing protein n=1 Tax=Xenopus laevis TaxID=8355 RepID=A0A974C914_XENLA|nr:hypothetical protein XELAEV_18040112mg [Xenopus laevis]